MARIPPGTVKPVGDSDSRDDSPGAMRESRTKQMLRGVKYGVVKGTVDEALGLLATPIAAQITPRLHEIHPGLVLADSAILSLTESAILTVLAIIFEFGGPHIAKVPGLKMSPEDAKAKAEALAGFMRNYAGEKLGEEIANTAAKLVPLVAGMLSDMDLSSLWGAVEVVEEGEAITVPATTVPAVHHATVGGGALTA